MQPDNQNNYWRGDETSEEISEMYTPSQINDEKQPNGSNQHSAVDNSDDLIHWMAKEYIDEERNWIWYALFAFVAIALIILDILVLKSYTFSALVVVMSIAMVIYTRRPAKTINYTLSGDHGLYIGEHLYHFDDFKAFGYIQDRGHNSILLIPIKRFSPGVSVYFPEEVGEKIIDVLGARLPMNNIKMDIFDVIVRKLRL